MREKKSDIMFSYALATENDAIAMYRFMLENLPERYSEAILHILNEEKEHAEMLQAMLDGREVNLEGH